MFRAQCGVICDTKYRFVGQDLTSVLFTIIHRPYSHKSGVAVSTSILVLLLILQSYVDNWLRVFTSMVKSLANARMFASKFCII